LSSFADDTVPCTFPPPAFGCPVGAFVAVESGACTLTIATCSTACANPSVARYALELEGGAALTLVEDHVSGSPSGAFVVHDAAP
jgi:hypothetical protein